MDFDQVIPFDAGRGGTIPNMCLDNVCQGYNIGNRYASAWEAWLHTEQHPDRNIPVGLDVPLYYSYTTTINGITQNYGHINVHLANGTVWSDGNIYNSIDDYTSKKLPRFVGWGESINDYKIIQGDDMSQSQVDAIYAEINKTNLQADRDRVQAAEDTQAVSIRVDSLTKPGGRLDVDYANTNKRIDGVIKDNNLKS